MNPPGLAPGVVHLDRLLVFDGLIAPGFVSVVVVLRRPMAGGREIWRRLMVAAVTFFALENVSWHQ